MTYATAPFFEDVALAPKGVECVWLVTSDNTRIRVAIWGAGKRGTIFLMPGRTEYIEKYGQAIGEFTAADYAVVCVDWRGQGLADRDTDRRGVGHVDNFDQFQDDMDSVLAVIKSRALPAPLFLIGHSMGGAIGLRGLHRNADFKAAVFSAPMWGINFNPVLRRVAWVLGAGSAAVGKSKWLAPGYSENSYTEEAAFEGNLLTRDREMFAYMNAQLAAHPDLGLGGPSVGWGYEAMRECRDLANAPAPKQPALTFYGTAEKIVVIDAIKKQMAKWVNGDLQVYTGGEHENMMEIPDVRNDFFARSVAFFNNHS